MTHIVHVLGPSPRTIEVVDEMVVGRGAECDLRFAEDRRMSRRHARLLVEDDRLIIEDLGGVNGTHVNDVPLRGRATLEDGDRILLGKTEIRVGDGQRARPSLVKPADQALPPDLGRMVADEFYAALGLGEQTLADIASHDDLIQRTRRFAVLQQISHAVQRADTVDELLDATLTLLLKVLPGDRGFVALVGADGVPSVVRSHGKRTDPHSPPHLSTTVTDYVVHRRASIISRDAATDDRFDGAASLMLNETRAVMAAPITQGDPVVGLLLLECSHLHRTFEEADVDLLTVVGAVLGQALGKLETIRALEQARADLLRTQQELIRSQQMAAIGRLATGIAHEVKNHLSPFMLADMIARKYPDDADIQESKAIMLEARQHILDLVNEVRQFASGADAGYRLEPTDLSDVVRGVLRFMQCDKVIKEARVDLEVNGEPWVQMDAPRFRQVLINLIRNAADAVPEDRAPHITLRVHDGADEAVVQVEDNGRGIDERDADRLFEPFFTTKGNQGLGLGLDICRKIIAAHAGTIDFESTFGVGTTFTVRLPAIRDGR